MRRIFVHGVIALCLAIALIDIMLGVDHWPFSSYPMYSEMYGPEYSSLRLYGVSPTGEFPVEEDALSPFHFARLSGAMDLLEASGDRVRLRAVLQNCLGIYERRRLEKKHKDPPISEMRLYRTTWNLATGRREPSRRELITSSRNEAK